MSAGIKTYNNAIAVDNDGSEAKTVLEAAKEKENQQDLWPLQKLHMPLRLLSVHTITAEKYELDCR